jgi:hypothetical protein
MKKLISTCVTTMLVLSSTLSAEFTFDKAPKEMSAYYTSKIQTLAEVQSKLKKNGFEILVTTEVIKDKNVITITNAELQATNSYLATINVLVNSEANEVRVQNPSYFGAAYLQDKYTYGQFKATLDALEKTLGTMSEVKEKSDFSDLPDYNFMFGMPHFDDAITVKTADEVYKKLDNPKMEKYIAYKLSLPNGNILVGHKLRKKTNKFLKTINQQQNAQLLPYKALVFANQVQILDPKYYLALSLPLLSMGEFMKIASIPDLIKKDIERVYK